MYEILFSSSEDVTLTSSKFTICVGFVSALPPANATTGVNNNARANKY